MQAQHSESFLRRERIIRYAGILLTLSPFGNFFWSSAISGIHHWWTPHVLGILLRHIPGVLWFLWSSTLLAGLLMLKGKRSSWTFTLCIVGMNVVFGIITFKGDIRQGWIQPTISLLINMGLFALIYTQEFHQRLERKLSQARLGRPFSVAVQRELKVHFEGVGNWARITEITQAGIRMQSIEGAAPRQVEFRSIEFALSKNLVLQAKFSARIGRDYIFRFTGMNEAKAIELQRWARMISSKPPTRARNAAA